MKVLLFLVIFVSFAGNSEELFLRVTAKFERTLGLPLVDDCKKDLSAPHYNDDGNLVEGICANWNSWHLFSANVKDVIKGELGGKKIEFALYAHGGFSGEPFKELFVLLKPLDNDRANFLKTKYYADEFLIPTSLVCIEDKLTDKIENMLSEKYEKFHIESYEKHYCYDTFDF